VDHIRQLIARSQKNDPAAFEKLIEVYQGRVFTLCRQLTNNPTDAQDLAQEVFIRAWSGLGGFRQEADFGTWLHRIAVNQWLNAKRRLNRLEIVSLDAPLTVGESQLTREAPSEDPGPAERFEQEEARLQLQQALQRLSPEHRAVLVLRELQDLNYEEIAAVLDCSLGTVKSRLNRARQALREELSSKS